MFLHGCNLHSLSQEAKTPAAGIATAIGHRSVSKFMSMPYFDRAVMEFIYYIEVPGVGMYG